jgi:DNA-binding CsgD family transcriptional regulator
MSTKSLTPAEQRFIDIHLRTGQSGQEDNPLPPPPYQVGGVEMLFTGVRFSGGVARELLPPDLEPAGSNSGLICAYIVTSGWGVAPFSAAFAAVEVKGFDAPDGSPGYCIVSGWYSGGGYRLMARHYNQFAQQGESRLSRDGDLVVGRAGPPGVDALVVRARPAQNGPPEAAVVHNYLGMHPAGGASLFAIAFSGMAINAEPVSIEMSDAAGERMLRARPREYTFGLHCYDANLTFGIPQQVGGSINLPGASEQVTLLDAFSRIGRAAIIVSGEGVISAMTPRAKSLLGDGLVASRGHLRASVAADQSALENIVSRAVGGESASRSPIAIRRQARPPLIVDAMSIGKIATGRPAALLLVNDTERPSPESTDPALQLLGLTRAEARIAGLVGAGHSPREAADQLDLSLNTVRSALKIAFNKLGISRQAELAKIVARLAG